MTVTVQIPDDLAQRLSAQGGDLSRRILEMLALEEFKNGRITRPELRQMLGFETTFQIDGFLESHELWINYTAEDLERERVSLERFGF